MLHPHLLHLENLQRNPLFGDPSTRALFRFLHASPHRVHRQLRRCWQRPGKVLVAAGGLCWGLGSRVVSSGVKRDLGFRVFCCQVLKFSCSCSQPCKSSKPPASASGWQSPLSISWSVAGSPKQLPQIPNPNPSTPKHKSMIYRLGFRRLSVKPFGYESIEVVGNRGSNPL